MRFIKTYTLLTCLFATSFISAQPFQTYDVYIVNTSSGAISQITSIPGAGEFNPAFSPNGKKIVHDVTLPGAQSLSITDVNTGTSSPLTGGDGGCDAAWSPDGKWIAFDRSPDGDPSIYYVPAGGGTRTLVRAYGEDPHWSPNSQRIVFVDDGIRTIKVDGTDETILTEFGHTPVWSPNGKYIAFGDGQNIWKIRVNNSGDAIGAPVNVTMNPYPFHSGQPSWSNNSKTIVTSTIGLGYFDIQTIPASGGSHTVLADVNMNNDYDPSYSRNGRWVAFSASEYVEEDELISNFDKESTKILEGNFPNPFTYSTNIRFQLEESTHIQIKIYNQVGQMVKTLANGKYPRGIHQVKWNGGGQDGVPLASGIYFYRMDADGIHHTKQMILLRD